MVEIGFATRNGRLWAHYRESRPSATTRAAVLFLHGWRSDAESGYGDLPDRLAEQGFPTLALDLPGHGKSQGDLDTLTYQELIEAAADSAAELLRRSGRDRLALVGSSVGGFLAARLTASLPVTALALWVPTDFADDLVDHNQPFATTALTESALAWRSALHPPMESGALRALSRFRGRALVI